jgi:hypothetical protein
MWRSAVARNFHELRTKVSCKLRGSPGTKTYKELPGATRADSPFAGYRGIENSGIPSGKKGIIAWFREMRGR